MRSEIASRVGGAALTEKFFRPHGRIVWRKAGSATLPRRKRRRIRKNARQKGGAVSMGRYSRARWKNVKETAASFMRRNGKRSPTRKSASRAGAVSQIAQAST